MITMKNHLLHESFQKHACESAGSRLRRKYLSALCAGLLVVLGLGSANAQIYKVTDDENGVVFTDRPETVSNDGTAGGEGHDKSTVERIEIPETNTVTPVQVKPRRARSSAPSDAGADADAQSPKVVITSPANEATIAMGPGNFTVSASATPPLARGESLLLTMDGQPVGSAQQSSSWSVQGALRGPHDLVVLRTARAGKTISSSEPVRIYVLRPSLIGR
ncbi:MAG: hypothetical protein AB8B57_07915 [Congregibacter sp.]